MTNTHLDISPWLTLAHGKGLGPVKLSGLLEQFGSPAKVLAAGRSALLETGLSSKSIDSLLSPDMAAIEKDLSWVEQASNRIITLADEDYPSLLKQTRDAPLVLYVCGDASLLNYPQLAIVGSRNPSPGGAECARDFAHYLAGVGMVITSGLAMGIDAAAHLGALTAGGKTIAVTGTGLDRVYPARHRDLAHDIAEQGVLVSEYSVGTPPLAANFPRRNRIISGLSLGVLVVEAAVQSGSLITARMAVEQNREVFAIPGSIHNPLAKGCHRLIRDGAKLVESAADIFEELGGVGAVTNEEVGQVRQNGSMVDMDVEYQRVLKSVGFEPTSVDTVVERSGLTSDAVCSMLLVLELQGYITAVSGGYYCQRV